MACRLVVFALTVSACWVLALAADCTTGTLSVNKYYDANTDAALTIGELPIGWQFQIISPGGGVMYVTTPWSMTVPVGTYRVCERSPTTYNWLDTAGDPACNNVTVTASSTALVERFCVCTGGAGAKKANYWASTTGGFPSVSGADLLALSALTLKTSAGTDADFANSAQLRSYLGVSFPGTSNPRYFLSFHFAASFLNGAHLVATTRRLKANNAIAAMLGTRFPTLQAVHDQAEFLLSNPGASAADIVALGTFISVANQNEGWIQAVSCTPTFSTPPADDPLGFTVPDACLTTGGGTTGSDCVHPSLSLVKLFDANGNGVEDSGEPEMAGWTFKITNLATGGSMYITPPVTLELPYGTFEVCDIAPLEYKWARTGIMAACRNVTLASPRTTEVVFTCVCTGPGTAKKTSHWANNPLRATITAGDLAVLSALPLKDQAGNDFDPTTLNQLTNFLKPAAAITPTNRYFLSMQLTASVLNTLKGLVSPTEQYRSKPELVSELGSAYPTIAQLQTYAQSLLSNPGSLSGLQLLAASQLNDLNGNQGWLQDAPCAFTMPSLPSLGSSAGLSWTPPAHCLASTTGGCPYGVINLTKVFDVNVNGHSDPGEVFIDNWHFTVTNLNTGGSRVFMSPQVLYLPLGDFMICDVAPTTFNWVSTGPALCRNVTLTGPTPVSLEAASMCFGESTQKSNNYWRGVVGQALISSTNLADLSALNLVDAAGNAFDPTAASDLDAFILDQDPSNTPYYLSVQLATMMLNIWHFVSPTHIIKANAGVGVILGNFPVLSAVTDLANTLLQTPLDNQGQQNSVAINMKSLSQGEGWAQSAPCSFAFASVPPPASDAGTHAPTVCSTTAAGPITTGACPYGVINLTKVFDVNTNGHSDPGETFISAWQFTVENTATGGMKYFESPEVLYLPLGEFTVCDVVPTTFNWVSTGPALCRTVNLVDSTPVSLEAASMCFGESTQKSNNYWAGVAGQALINAADLTLLRDLRLWDAAGNAFDPVDASELIPFIIDQDPTNTPYYLSVQVATMMLNIQHFVSPTHIIKANPGVAALIGSFPNVFDVAMSGDTYLAVPGDNLPQQAALAANMKALSQGEGWAQATPCSFAFAAHSPPASSDGTSLPAYCGLPESGMLLEGEALQQSEFDQLVASPAGTATFTAAGIALVVVGVVAVALVIRRRNRRGVKVAPWCSREATALPSEIESDELEVYTEK